MTFQKSPQWKNKTYGHRLARAPCRFPQSWSSGPIKIQVVVRDKKNQMHIFKGFNDQK
jgi:hypothetical protein